MTRAPRSPWSGSASSWGSPGAATTTGPAGPRGPDATSFVLNTCTKEETRDIYELVESRSRTRSTIYCSQYREPGWLERLGGGTSAEGIVDRITNNCYRVDLSGDVNMRELTSRVAR